MEILGDATAGDPMKEGLVWTHLRISEIIAGFKKRAITIGRSIVKQLFAVFGYVKRQMRKCKSLKEVAHRNGQFEHIAALKADFIAQGLPVLSIDTKKKELLGNFYRAGKCYTQAPVEVNDHDFASFAQGVVIPQGIYDVQQDKCYLTIGTSKDTAAFVCDNLAYYWQNALKEKYSNAQKMLILCDGGGSNSCLHHVVKEALQGLANQIDTEIVLAHYPAYCSKWNPIEHRAFCHITKSWQGAVFDSYETVTTLAQKARTNTGFSVQVRINKQVYQTGKKASQEFLAQNPVVFDEFLPKWNYTFRPQRL
jgi:hypothetical protein